VFKGAPDALLAAIAIQRASVTRVWKDGVQVRIRIGLHTGRPTLTDTGYVGLAVSTAARVCASARGGQIVMSDSSRQAAEPSRPQGVSFLDLGLQQLRGLPEPERLFQVEAAEAI
jgi:class 3 adenylate cyclase